MNNKEDLMHIAICQAVQLMNNEILTSGGLRDAFFTLRTVLEAVADMEQDEALEREPAPDRYWGVYCPQHNVWLHKTDGSFYYYPSPAIAQAHVDTDLQIRIGDHLWETAEFGKQRPIKASALSFGSPICPVEAWEPSK